MQDPYLVTQCDVAERTLHARGYPHPCVRVDGKHLVVYTEDGDERHNRARFTALSRRQYQLGMANHRGILEPTPFTGPLDELIAQLTDELGFTLVPG